MFRITLQRVENSGFASRHDRDIVKLEDGVIRNCTKKRIKQWTEKI